jgi:hypothetical protein
MEIIEQMNTKALVSMGVSNGLRTPAIALVCMVGLSLNATAKAQTIDRYFTIQPIQVCNNAGLNCAPTPLFPDETAKIYQQAGVAPIFLPTTQLLDPNLLMLMDGDMDDNFIDEIDQAGNGQHLNPTTINMWFVQDLLESSGILYGEAWINANGVVIDGNAVQNFNSGNGRRDTIAHEIGHNLGLRHSNFGAGGANNLMTAGTAGRLIPDGVGNIIPDGADLSQLTMAQIDAIRSSPLLNQVPEVIVDTNGSTPFNTDDFFLVDFQDGPAGVFLQSLTMDLAPVNAFFDSVSGGSIGQFPGGDGSPFSLSNLSGLNATDITLVGGNNALDGEQQLTLNFAPNSFVSGDSFRFGIDVDLFSNIDGFGAMPDELIGTLFSFTFSDGFGSQAEIEDDLIASSIRPMNILPFSGQPTGGPQIPPGRVTDDPDPEPVPEPSGAMAVLLMGLGGLCFGMKKRNAKAMEDLSRSD